MMKQEIDQAIGIAEQAKLRAYLANPRDSPLADIHHRL
jgi:hypothetical protein